MTSLSRWKDPIPLTLNKYENDPEIDCDPSCAAWEWISFSKHHCRFALTINSKFYLIFSIIAISSNVVFYDFDSQARRVYWECFSFVLETFKWIRIYLLILLRFQNYDPGFIKPRQQKLSTVQIPTDKRSFRSSITKPSSQPFNTNYNHHDVPQHFLLQRPCHCSRTFCYFGASFRSPTGKRREDRHRMHSSMQARKPKLYRPLP